MLLNILDGKQHTLRYVFISFGVLLLTYYMALAITDYFNLLHFTLDCTDRAFTEQVAGATFEQNHLQ